MKLTRILFVAAALLVPASWTVAKAGDDKPAEGDKKEKKGKKGKKGDGDKPADKAGDKPADKKDAKK